MNTNHGTVIDGEYAGWKIEVVDDTQGDTGGFFLVFRNNTAEVFDYWFETKQFIDNQLADFTIQWNR